MRRCSSNGKQISGIESRIAISGAPNSVEGGRQGSAPRTAEGWLGTMPPVQCLFYDLQGLPRSTVLYLRECVTAQSMETFKWTEFTERNSAASSFFLKGRCVCSNAPV